MQEATLENYVIGMQKKQKYLKKLRHPHIIQRYEILIIDKEINLIMEYASEGELFEYIVKNNKVLEKQACKFDYKYNQELNIYIKLELCIKI